MKGGYDSIYLGLITKLSGYDFQEAADRLGLEYVDDSIRVCFLRKGTNSTFLEGLNDFEVSFENIGRHNDAP